MSSRTFSLITAFLFLAACAPETQTGIRFESGNEEEMAQAEDIALTHLFMVGGLADSKGVDDVKVMRTHLDMSFMAHTKVQQTFKGVPVFEAEAIVHLSQDGKFAGITDKLLDRVSVNTEPYYNADEAIEMAVDTYYEGWDVVSDTPTAELWILRHEGKDHLVWKVQIQRLDQSNHEEMPLMFIDAHTGELVWGYNNLQSATCTGSTNFYGNVSVDCNNYRNTYYLEDTVENLGTYSWNNTTTNLYYSSSASSAFANSNATAKNAFEAHYVMQQVYSYYLTSMGRNGIDGAGGPTPVSAHGDRFISTTTSYSRNYVNAFWNSTTGVMVYGDGDGTTAGSMTTLDIGGHEMTHGVTQYEANLTYSGESGGLNESMSDVFGAMVERSVLGETANTWMIGEQTWTPNTAGDALRYMNDPAADGHSADYYTSTLGNLDVHYSSGVPNLAFYLLSEGGTHPRGASTTVVTGIGADDAADIWYLALSSYLTANGTMSDARTATLSAAAALFGSASTQYTQVGNAWTAVGVNAAAANVCSTSNYSSSLARSRSSSYQPSSAGVAALAGTQTFSLTGPANTDFDLYLQARSGNSWVTVASSLGSTSTESLSYAGSAGTYRAVVYSYSGSGNFSLSWCKP